MKLHADTQSSTDATGPTHDHEWWAGSRGQFNPRQCLVCGAKERARCQTCGGRGSFPSEDGRDPFAVHCLSCNGEGFVAAQPADVAVEDESEASAEVCRPRPILGPERVRHATHSWPAKPGEANVSLHDDEPAVQPADVAGPEA